MDANSAPGELELKGVDGIPKKTPQLEMAKALPAAILMVAAMGSAKRPSSPMYRGQA